jgi:sugar phosphate permease
MNLERKLKVALDESRLLILGAQVVFGFQFNGVFQEQFDALPVASQVLLCVGLTLLMLAVVASPALLGFWYVLSALAQGFAKGCGRVTAAFASPAAPSSDAADRPRPQWTVWR